MKPYNIYVRIWAVDEGKTKTEKDALLSAVDNHIGKTPKNKFYINSGNLIYTEIADDENILTFTETDREKEIAANYKTLVKSFLKDVSKTKSYMFEVIKSEHVLGGHGNKEGSTHLSDYDYAQINNKEVSIETFKQTYRNNEV